MYRLTSLVLPVAHAPEELKAQAARLLHVKERDIGAIRILRRSIDARKKPKLFYVYTLDVDTVRPVRLSGKHNNIMSIKEEESYRFPVCGREKLTDRPVIVGAGPAGLFAAYVLAEHGYQPLIIERGDPVELRTAKVKGFWEGGSLDPDSNVQFGEGGAGTFSDGKLTCSVKDPGHRSDYIRRVFCEHGAAPEILFDMKPHIGTDVLTEIMKSMRSRILSLGGEYRFRTKMTGFTASEGRLTGIIVNENETIPASVCILAPGHSARDTFLMLHKAGIPMEAKAFAAGIRIEHPQDMIDISQYGENPPACLGPAPYRLAETASDGRGVYSFCMCPGGYVVNASSEEGRIAVNGMSYSGRNSKNANSALLVSVTPADTIPYLTPDLPQVLAGAAFQRQLESAAFRAGEGAVPQQLLSDFAKGQKSTAFGDFSSCIKGRAAFADLCKVLPDFMRRDILEVMPVFGRRIAGFDREDAILSGVESRSSSPVRVRRGENFSSCVEGLYPCGEGAGYAGGIMSAAMDGMRCAEACAARFAPLDQAVSANA